jgi:hypothetical protein
MLDQWRRAVIGGYANIFEYIRPEQEVDFIFKWIERFSRLDQPGGLPESIEAVVKIDPRPGDRRTAKRRTEKFHMRQFIDCNVPGVLLDRRGFEWHGAAADDIAECSLAAGIGGCQAGAIDCGQIKRRFQILKIQSEIQDVDVTRRTGGQRGHRAGGGKRRGGRGSQTGYTK